MKSTLLTVWRPVKGMDFNVIEDNLFLFQFHHIADKQRVMLNGPWSFDKHLILLNEVDAHLQLSEVLLSEAAFWIQVHNLPLISMTKEVGYLIGNKIGSSVDVEYGAGGMAAGRYMRIRVTLNMAKPLRRKTRPHPMSPVASRSHSRGKNGDAKVSMPRRRSAERRDQEKGKREQLLNHRVLKSGPKQCGLAVVELDSSQKKPNQDGVLLHGATHEAYSMGPIFPLTKEDTVSLDSSVSAKCLGPSLLSHSMDIDKGLVLSNPNLVIREEPLVSLAPAGTVGKKLKKIARNQKGTAGSSELPMGVKRSLIGEKDSNLSGVKLVLGKMKAVASQLQTWNWRVLAI
ncbi:hypothetical protein LOK49_LG15G01883 [Camellia lanceoleosa]|uniref:Uncharacterized protein n=1 Tax=Camellia lanceoleosa TaxID=1840588 RepID=A0ACC0F1V5_9ERIC|nr:hypothetical protein LOK49_LG15G01883 [Camellia lanceoleosa]